MKRLLQVMAHRAYVRISANNLKVAQVQPFENGRREQQMYKYILDSQSGQK